MALNTTSCSSRKVAKSETEIKTETEVKSTSEIKTEVKTQIFTLDTSTTNEIEFIPVDNTKPILIDGKKYDNVIVRRVNKKNNVVTIENEKVSQIAKKEGKKTEKSNKQSNVKETTKPDAPIVNTWKNVWFILELAFYLFLLIAIYYIYKKYIQPRLNNQNNLLS